MYQTTSIDRRQGRIWPGAKLADNIFKDISFHHDQLLRPIVALQLCRLPVHEETEFAVGRVLQAEAADPNLPRVGKYAASAPHLTDQGDAACRTCKARRVLGIGYHVGRTESLKTYERCSILSNLLIFVFEIVLPVILRIQVTKSTQRVLYWRSQSKHPVSLADPKSRSSNSFLS